MSVDRKKARVALVALGVILVVGVAAIPAPQPQNTVRYAYVSSELILRQTPGFAQAESTLTAEIASYRGEVQRLQQVLDSAITAFNQQSIVLTPTARSEKTDELRSLQQQLENRTTELQTRAQERQRELVSPLEDRIQRVIDGLRAERNLSLIFDVSAPGNNIVSADPVLDLTGTVVRRLQGASGP
jgi:Skp family chaperone for outer membrane proteins